MSQLPPTAFAGKIVIDASKSRRERLALFVAGDDAASKHLVAQLIDAIGFAAVDTGSLRQGGRRQQPSTPLYNVPLTAEQAEARLAAEREQK